MTENFAVVVARGAERIEVSAPDADWVERQLSELLPRLDQLPQAAAGLSAEAESAQAPLEGRPRPRPRARVASRSRQNPELELKLTKEVRARLERYVGERRHAWDGSQPAQAAIVATFLADNLDWDGVDASDLYTVYTGMGWKLPGNIRSQLLNAQQRAGFFRGARDGKYELSHAGENFARHGSTDEEST